VVVTDSGLQYQIIEAGEGDVPGADDTVEVHYLSTLVDGTEVDSSYARGETVSFVVGQVIPGWTEALQLMPVGSKWKLAIPPELGFGAGGAGQMIGPNSALIFEVELVAIPRQAEATEAPAQAAPEG
jgi:FKBP-type peptidyl-prolyl cis-trans isomerase